jgi:hypothetical protein
MFLKKLLLASVAMAALVPVAWAELPAAGDYLIQNVETGYYLGGGNEYGTHASLIKEPQWFSLTVSGSGYVLNSNQNRNNNTYLGTNLYCDSGSTVWTIEEVESGVYTISNTSGYITGNGKTLSYS